MMYRMSSFIQVQPIITIPIWGDIAVIQVILEEHEMKSSISVARPVLRTRTKLFEKSVRNTITYATLLTSELATCFSHFCSGCNVAFNDEQITIAPQSELTPRRTYEKES